LSVQVDCAGVATGASSYARLEPGDRWSSACGTWMLTLWRRSLSLLTVYNHIKVQVDLQAVKSPVVVKGHFFPQVVNPRYRIRGTNV
jgi:hypothetical protein